MNTLTFNTKYKYGDTVFITFGKEILEMKVTGILCSREYPESNRPSDSVEYWLTGKTTTAVPENSIFSSKEELLKHLTNK